MSTRAPHRLESRQGAERDGFLARDRPARECRETQPARCSRANLRVSLLSLVLVVGVLVVGAGGCTASAGPRDAGPVDDEESGEALCSDGLDNDSDGVFDCAEPACAALASCRADDGGPRRDAGFMECVGDPYEAEETFAPVDIIWVVDTSGSMSDEAERVQENMASFAASIGGVGIDWHVVMISTQSFVNVPEPLASDPRYLLIDRAVNSNEPLQALLDEFPRYGSFLRRRAFTHFVAVTDDNSNLAWESFRDSMVRNLERNFTFHTISSELAGPSSFMYPDGQPCTTSSGFPPEGAADVGEEYWELAGETGGRTFSICTPASEWATLFGSLTAAIAIPVSIPCEYAIPEPPAGEALNFMRVNIVYTPGSGSSPEVLLYVGSADGADCTDGGWYYDDVTAPRRVILCPSTCSRVNGDAAGRVDVELGCETEGLI